MRIDVLDDSAVGGVPTPFVGGPADGDVKTVNREYKKYIISLTITPTIPNPEQPPIVEQHIYILDESGDPRYRYKGVK